MGTRIALLVATALLAACGGSDGDTDASSTPATASAAPAATLAETCPEVEAGMPDDDVPEPEEWQAFADRLHDLRDAGDTETKNALDFMIRAVEQLASPSGDPLDAFTGYTDALTVMRDRCKAVGSSSMQ